MSLVSGTLSEAGCERGEGWLDARIKLGGGAVTSQAQVGTLFFPSGLPLVSGGIGVILPA